MTGYTRKAVLAGTAVSTGMVNAAQASYEQHPSYGLTWMDMAKAIRAALDQAAKEAKT